jgi:glycosyltransferase involved in cell wall biosynthesis
MERTLKSLTKELRLEERVHFMETVPQSVLLEYTTSADIGVIPYQNTCLNNYYCTPNKLFEFIAAGLPFIGTDLPEISRIVRAHQIGLTGNTGEPQALAKLIEQALEPSALARFRENIAKAREIVNWQHEGQRFTQIVEKLVPLERTEKQKDSSS